MQQLVGKPIGRGFSNAKRTLKHYSFQECFELSDKSKTS
jgi:hypothetical protein